MPMSKWILRKVGVMPVGHHYYDPIVYQQDLRKPLDEERTLPAVDMNVREQLDLLRHFDYNQELLELPFYEQNSREFYYMNHWFGPGDAEFLYNMIRYRKPSTIIEIGCGYSTLMAQHGIQKNTEDDPLYSCHQLCVEPFENQWLESIGVNVIRSEVQALDLKDFSVLDTNDILFIDSSHVIRPQGDVLYEYLELLSSLKSGVIIHIHDIFTPRDYLHRWVVDESKLFNEQYILEAFLSHNQQFRIIGSLNYLWHNYSTELFEVCPVLKLQPFDDPSSFWLIKN